MTTAAGAMQNQNGIGNMPLLGCRLPDGGVMQVQFRQLLAVTELKVRNDEISFLRLLSVKAGGANACHGERECPPEAAAMPCLRLRHSACIWPGLCFALLNRKTIGTQAKQTSAK